jgi:hypothetical protein
MSAGKRSEPGERVNVYLLRQDLPGLLRLQANLLTNDIESSRNLVLRCAVDLLGKAQEKPSSWMRVVRLVQRNDPLATLEGQFFVSQMTAMST